MRIPFPLFGNRISPRFDFSPKMWTVELDGDEAVSRRRFFSGNLSLPQPLEQVVSNGVDKVICAGIDGYSPTELGTRGIEVVHDVIGEAEVALYLFMRGRLRSGLCCERRRRGCPWRGGPRGQRNPDGQRRM